MSEVTKKECYYLALEAINDELASTMELDPENTEKIDKWKQVADYLRNELDNA